jgi:uncharacterized membrane protein YcaP (DUF421 family)
VPRGQLDVTGLGHQGRPRAPLHREFITHEELFSALRLYGLTIVAQVKHTRLEPNGMISIIPDDDAHPEDLSQPATP